MQLTITSVDHAPEELHEQVPVRVKLLRELPGPDRPDYWLAETDRPLRWLDGNVERQVTHLVLAARWAGTRITPGVENLPIGIAYVKDQTQTEDPAVIFSKCRYTAIGLATETGSGNRPEPLAHVMAGSIARSFGMGGES